MTPTTDIAEALTTITGPEHVRHGEAITVSPANTQQVSDVLRFANENKLTLAPIGGGTKQSWGNPTQTNIHLNLTRLNRVIEHPWQDLTCTVQAGCTWQHLQEALKKHGQFVALDPLWPRRATVGGILAANDSGALRHRYGSLRDLVIGMTLVLADGTIARSGGKVVKNVAGYDLCKLVTGSLGTLAVITEATFRLHPLPQHVQTFTVSAPQAAQLAPLMASIRASQLLTQAIQLRGDSYGFHLDIQLNAHPEAKQNETLDQMTQLTKRELRRVDENVWLARERHFTDNDAFTIKATMLPTDVASFSEQVLTLKGSCVTQANGIMIADFLAPTHTIAYGIELFREELEKHKGSIAILKRAASSWSDLPSFVKPPEIVPLMQALKRQFDPNRILSPDRFFWRNLAIKLDKPPHKSRSNPNFPKTLRNSDRGMSTTKTMLTEIQLEPSSFDKHHPPSKDLLSDCVHCGFCLPACPTYVLWGEEMDSPRGRVYMMAKASQGEAPLDQNFRTHMDRCLGCMACMTACPSGVQYDKLIEDSRAQVERNIARTTADSLFRKMLFATFPYPKRLKLMAGPLLLYQRFGLQSLVRASGLLKFLPKRIAAMESLLPAVPENFTWSMPERVSATPPSRGRVGMLTGCVQQVFFSHVNVATARVLSAEGFEVIVPASQPCCGALMVHSGLEDQAAAMARILIALFEEADVDTIVVNAAGCGSTMKEYGHLLRDDPQWADRAHAFSAKCKDITEILTSLPARALRHPLPIRIAYHDACHLRHAQGIHQQPRQLLSAIPQLEVAEIAEASLCCGSAGVYNLLQPEAAQQLGDRKVNHLLDTQSQAVVSANPGCLLQLMSGLRRRGERALPAFHIIQLLDASIRGIQPDQILQL